MAYSQEAYYSDQLTAARAIPSERAKFIRLTYAHLGGAILAFVGVEAALFAAGLARPMTEGLFGRGNVGMLFLMLAFVGVGYAAQALARSRASMAAQYAGLALYVVLEAVIILPLLYIASLKFPDDNLIMKAGLLTGALVFGLSTAVFMTKADFSFLRVGLSIGMWVAIATIVISMFMGFSLGLLFFAAMILLASGYVVYTTSNILHHYPTDMYVAAALELFAAVALLFYYILLFMMRQGSNRN